MPRACDIIIMHNCFVTHAELRKPEGGKGASQATMGIHASQSIARSAVDKTSTQLDCAWIASE